MTPDTAIGTVVTICLYTDLRYRKIYNLVLLPAFLLALTFNLLTGGISGIWSSLIGALLGLGLLIVPFVLGGMGAGDVKLLAVIGAWQGPQFVWLCFLCTALAGGIMASWQLIRTGKFLPTLKFALFTLLPGTPKVNAYGTLATTKTGEAFPYGVAIAAGTVATYLLR